MYKMDQLEKSGVVIAVSDMREQSLSFKNNKATETIKNKKAFLKKLNIDPTRVVDMSTDGKKLNKVRKVSNVGKQNTLDKSKDPYWVDALITNKSNLFLAMYPADCFGVVIHSPKNNVLSLIHAGYKQVDRDVINLSISKIKKEYKVKPGDMTAVVTPGIGKCCLKGKDIDNIDIHSKKSKKYISKKSEYFHLDLLKWISDELKKAGIKKIYKSNVCSVCSTKPKFYSHRKQKNNKQEYGRGMLVVGQR